MTDKSKWDGGRITAIVLMVVGGITWLAGELIGVFRKEDGGDTTSEFVWHLPKWARAIVVVFVISLAAHFAFAWPLFPWIIWQGI